MSDGWRLYADMGNSALLFAAHGPDGWSEAERMILDEDETPRDTAMFLRAMLVLGGYQVSECSGAALLSSNPRTTEHVEEALADLTGQDVALMGRDLHSELPIDYHESSQMGQDRIAAVEGARALCGAPVVVLSCGSCLTAQALTAEGVIIAGGIAPGLRACASGIGAAAPHLSELASAATEAIVDAVIKAGRMPSPCRDTTENLVMGLVAAVIGSAEIMATLMQAEAEAEDPVMLTGAWAPVVHALADGEWRLESKLTLEGLRAVHERTLEE